MKKTHLLSSIFLASSMVTIMPNAIAHHSYAMFDQTKTKILNATVKKYKWTNPHAWIEVTAPNEDGQEETWAVEMNAPNNLKLEGFKRRTFRSGDLITLTINPLRNGKAGGAFVGVKLADGTELGFGKIKIK